FTEAGARFGLRPECVVAAYGMAETVLGVSFAPVDTGLRVDTVDADELESNRRAVPVAPGVAHRYAEQGAHTRGQRAGRHAGGGGPAVRRFPLLGPPLPGLRARVVDDSGRVLGDREVGALQLRG